MESERAGKESACAGCPNQGICASGAVSQVDPDLELIQANLGGIDVPLLVVSGKGGVGKSTFTAQLSYLLAMQQQDVNVACLDVDICGPSIPIMMQKSYLDINENMDVNAETRRNGPSTPLAQPFIYSSADRWTPHMVEDNLAVMSIGYLLEDSDAAVIWRGPKKHELIKKFLKDVDWGEDVAYLVIDTPPGTSDEHLSLTKLLAFHPHLCAVLVTTPQELSLQDVRREIDFLKNKAKVPIVGIVENMAHFVCPNCNASSLIFPSNIDHASNDKRVTEEHSSLVESRSATLDMANSLGIPFLGSIPLDPRIGKACDQGAPFISMESAKASTLTRDALISVVSNLRRNILQLKRDKARQLGTSSNSHDA